MKLVVGNNLMYDAYIFPRLSKLKGFLGNSTHKNNSYNRPIF